MRTQVNKTHKKKQKQTINKNKIKDLVQRGLMAMK
jgi:hypothetical protein